MIFTNPLVGRGLLGLLCLMLWGCQMFWGVWLLCLPLENGWKLCLVFESGLSYLFVECVCGANMFVLLSLSCFYGWSKFVCY